MDDFKDLNPSQLREFMDQHREKDYLLVDVRQPGEYERHHIPGATLMPLSELESRLFDLPSDRDLVFYCHVGGRSKAAASLAVDAEVSEKGVYQLLGGIMAWDGRTLSDYPRMELFQADKEMSALLMTAMDLEKGAYRFYQKMLQRFPEEPFSETLAHLSKAETAHAKAVYGFWKQVQPAPEPFDSLYDGLKGETLEGGQSLEAMMGQVENLSGDPCMRLMELALDMEYTAYDLYRNLAERTRDPEEKRVFLSIAQGEKSHMKSIARGLAQCPGAG